MLRAGAKADLAQIDVSDTLAGDDQEHSSRASLRQFCSPCRRKSNAKFAGLFRSPSDAGVEVISAGLDELGERALDRRERLLGLAKERRGYLVRRDCFSYCGRRERTSALATTRWGLDWLSPPAAAITLDRQRRRAGCRSG